jgi:hypothetical protein
MKKYPDISEIIKKKERHRRFLASLPFEEKIEMVFKLQARRKAIKSARAAQGVKKSTARPKESR